MMRISCALAALLVCALSSAHAGVISTSGSVELVSTPSLLSYTNNLNLSQEPSLNGPGAVIFREHSGYTAAPFFIPQCECNRRLAVDIAEAGTYTQSTGLEVEIDDGVLFDSYILHFEPTDRSNVVKQITGSVTFSDNIIGLMTYISRDLVEQQFTLSNINLSAASWLELFPDDEIGDSLTLSTDLRTVFFDFKTTTATEDMRIFVAHASADAPAPGSMILLGLGLWFCLGRRLNDASLAFRLSPG